MSPLTDLGGLPLLVAYLLLLAGTAVQYRREKLSGTRAVLLVGMCLTWLSYALLQVTQGGVVPTGTPLNYALDALAVVVLVAGVAAMAWWWRTRDET
ncbi:hypothetical protein [Haloferax sulfurifontis]|uniref:YapH protein n=2 Tax=Haloferax sulfurifontis TaxID=255616 RepID=M0I580_9EURY|nr:hypothetical protein [Haloferax sulfurifontis]ELZ91117.1 hypothetical protein C441_12320 [Haloferax sulfurifontis ATCC BAA-897]GGC44928.1 hypothetical protein GCM10007209_03270 [Haloferax sulfurifontis]